jgi:hypothetical protein
VKRELVESSCVSEVGYDPDSGDMEIKFVSGSVYVYSNVTPEKHKEIIQAASVGKAFWDLIRRQEDEHPYVRLS